MRIDFQGKLTDEKEIRAGFIGCGSHAFRNIFPTFQFAPVNLVATCDLSIEKAQAYALKFGAKNAYADYRQMVEKEKLDAVFVVTGYDENSRPLYPQIAIDCMRSGCHVWMEKPPAASCGEIELMQEAANKYKRNVVVGMKKMFYPANEKAWELAHSKEFGKISLVLMQYPQSIPAADELKNYILSGRKEEAVEDFLDHLCHPASLMVYLLGFPSTMFFDRSASGSGVLTFSFDSGVIASLALTEGASHNGGMERTTIVSDNRRHIVVDNNIRVSYHQTPPNLGYGCSPSFFNGSRNEATAQWEPEFSLGQLYNKGIFLLGYYNEVNEFARSVLENRAPAKGTLEQAWQVTRIFEKFVEGPRKLITLK